MQMSEKTDEVLTAHARGIDCKQIQVKALLIRCNFSLNSVSNIAERSGSCLHYALK